MNAHVPEPTASNPFSTRFIRPGALAYRYPPGVSAEVLLNGLAASRWRGQIVGPHGSGKSTLLGELELALQSGYRRHKTFCLRDGQRALPAGWLEEMNSSQANLIVVDGYEQLGGWNRWLLKLRCRWRGWGLLVTAHADMGFPTLLETSGDLSTVQALVAQLTAGSPATLSTETVAETFQATGGDTRETFFRLYDKWENLHRRRSANAPS